MSKTDISEMEYQKGYDDGLDDGIDQGWANREAIAVKSLIEKDVYIDKLEQQIAALTETVHLISKENDMLLEQNDDLYETLRRWVRRYYISKEKARRPTMNKQELQSLRKLMTDYHKLWKLDSGDWIAYVDGLLDHIAELDELCKQADEQIKKSKNKSTEDE